MANRTTPRKPKPKLRLLKVMVQPVYVLELDDGTLDEQTTGPIAVSAAEWPTFATTRYVEIENELKAKSSAPRGG